MPYFVKYKNSIDSDYKNARFGLLINTLYVPDIGFVGVIKTDNNKHIVAFLDDIEFDRWAD